jgi:hypothetical protein
MMLGTKEILLFYLMFFMLTFSYIAYFFIFILISFLLHFNFNLVEMDNLAFYLFFRFKIIKESQGS